MKPYLDTVETAELFVDDYTNKLLEELDKVQEKHLFGLIEEREFRIRARAFSNVYVQIANMIATVYEKSIDLVYADLSATSILRMNSEAQTGKQKANHRKSYKRLLATMKAMKKEESHG